MIPSTKTDRARLRRIGVVVALLTFLVIVGGSDPSRKQPSRRLSLAALAAYGAIIEAFNRHDQTAYSAAFASPMECFYGRRQVAMRRTTEGRLHSHLLAVVSSTATRATLVELGAYEVDELHYGLHEKLIVMEHRDGRWLVVAEDRFREPGCIEAPSSFVVPPAFAQCVADERGCAAELDRTYGPGSDNEDSVHGYSYGLMACRCAMWSCVGSPQEGCEGFSPAP